jgi:hypothetical protein
MGFRHVNHLNRTYNIMFTIEFWVTLAFLAGGAVFVGLMVWLEKRPKTRLQPHMLPTTLIMVLSALVALVAGFHLIDLVKPVAGH